MGEPIRVTGARDGFDLVGTLYDEHQLIQRYGAVLRRAVVRLESGEVLPRAFFLDLAWFGHEFVLGYHHHKEEGLLFAALRRRVPAPTRRAIEAMKREHEQSAVHLREIRLMLGPPGDGDEARMRRLGRALGAYTSDLMMHLEKEERFLFPMARRLLGETETARVTHQFRREETQFGPTFLLEATDVLRRLEQQVMR